MGKDADDAEVLNSTERDPSFTPAVVGDYEITLSLDEGGDFPASVTKTIHVSEIGLGVPVLRLKKVTASSIKIKWTEVENATAYDLSRDGGDWINLGTDVTYRDENLGEGEEHCYRVRARKGSAVGEASDQLCATTLSAPAAAPELSVGDTTSTSIALSWTAVDDATGYALYRGDDQDPIYSGEALSYTDVGLNPETEYCYTIEASNEVGAGPRSEPLVCATTAEASELGTPTLEISNFTANSISLRWSRVENADRYDLFHKMDDETSFIALETVSGTAYGHTGLEPGHHHYYQVRAYSTELGPGAFSNTVEKLLAPGAPGNLQAVARDASHIDLSWNTVFGADSYEVSRNNGSWSEVGNIRSWTDDTVEAGTEYCYRVRAVNATGNGPASSEACATPPVEGAPGNLQVMVVCASEINVSWDAVAGAAGYRIRVDGGSWTDVGNVTSYQHTDLDAGTQYCYEVRAYNSESVDGPSAGPACAMTWVAGAPENLQTTAVSASEIDLSWDAVAGAVGYKLRVDSGSWSDLGNVTTYQNTGLAAGTEYCYEVLAYNSAGVDGDSAGPACATTLVAGAPGNLTARVEDEWSIFVEWDSVEGAAGYEISTDDGTIWTDISTNTVYPHNGLDPGTEYCYEVRAYNSAGDGGPIAGPVCATTEMRAPDFLTATAEDDRLIVVDWGPVEGAAGYEISTDDGTTWTDVGTDPNYFHDDLNPGTEYCYEVRIYNSVGDGGPIAGPVCATTLVAGAPTNLQATAASSGEINVNWDAVAGADGYRIRVDSGGWTDVPEANGTSYQDVGLAAGVEHCYEVLAYNSAGVDGDSAGPACATTTGGGGGP